MDFITVRLAGAFSAFSSLLNALIFGGNSNESLSGRCYREQRTTAMGIINCVFFWQSNHCRGAHNNDLTWAKEYAKLPTRIGE